MATADQNAQSPVTLDMSKSIPVTAPAAGAAAPAASADPYAGVTLDMSKSMPVTPPTQPGVVARSWDAVKDYGKSAYNGVASLVKPPETPTEGLMSHVGGEPGLFAYRASKDLLAAADRMAKAVPEDYQQAMADFKKATDEFHNKDYRGAATSVGSGVSGFMHIADPLAPPGRELTEGMRPGGNLAGPVVKNALNVAGIVAGSPEAEGTVPFSASRTLGRMNPFRNPAADMGEAAVRGGVDEAAATQGVSSPSATRPILKGNQTILDEPIQSLATKEKAAYQRLDEAAGFDLKAAKDQLKLDQRAVKQPGLTPDALKSIQERMADNADHIGQAEKNLTDHGIDPKAGDVLHTARMAGQDFKNTLVKTTGVDGEINIDKLLTQSKALRFNRRGDRLVQFMGQDGADEFMSQLEAAQKAGVHAMKVQKVAKWVGGLAAGALGYEAGAAGVHALMAP